MRQTLHVLAVLCFLSASLSGCGGGSRGTVNNVSNTLSLFIQNAKWVAIQDGAQSWSIVCDNAPCNIDISKQINDIDGKYGVAVVCNLENQKLIYIDFSTLSESNNFKKYCQIDETEPGKINGRIIFTAQNMSGDVSFCSNSIISSFQGITNDNASFSVSNIFDTGLLSIVASERDSMQTKRVYIEKNFNIIGGVATTKDIDFGNDNAFDLNGPQYDITITGLDPSEAVQTYVDYHLSEGCWASLSYSSTNPGGTVATSNYTTIPADRSSLGDKYELIIMANYFDGEKVSYRYMQKWINQGPIVESMTNAPMFALPSVDVLSTSPVLLKTQWNAYPNPYVNSYSLNFFQDKGVVNQHNYLQYLVTVSKNRMGSNTSYSQSLPDFSTLASWNAEWNFIAPTEANPINWNVSTLIIRQELSILSGRSDSITSSQ